MSFTQMEIEKKKKNIRQRIASVAPVIFAEWGSAVNITGRCFFRTYFESYSFLKDAHHAYYIHI